MAWIALLLIIAIPVAEIAFFIQAVDVLGVIPAILGAVLAGMAGMALLRRQGLATALRAKEQLSRGEMPLAEVFDGLCLLAAGLLLLVPGFLTDFLALPLLIPPVRRALRAALGPRFVVTTPHGPYGGHHSPGPRVIEADYQELDENGRPR